MISNRNDQVKWACGRHPLAGRSLPNVRRQPAEIGPEFVQLRLHIGFSLERTQPLTIGLYGLSLQLVDGPGYSCVVGAMKVEASEKRIVAWDSGKKYSLLLAELSLIEFTDGQTEFCAF